MEQLTSEQIAVLKQFMMRGFQPIAFPLYPGAVGIRRCPFAVLLEPAAGSVLRQFGPAFYVIEGNLSVRISRGDREWFVWKTKQVEATPDVLADLAQFSAEVSSTLISTI